MRTLIGTVSVIALGLAFVTDVAQANPKNKFSDGSKAIVNAATAAKRDAYVESFNHETEILSTQELKAYFSYGTIQLGADAAKSYKAAAAAAGSINNAGVKIYDNALQNFAGINNQNIVTAQFNNNNVATSIAAHVTNYHRGSYGKK